MQGGLRTWALALAALVGAASACGHTGRGPASPRPSPRAAHGAAPRGLVRPARLFAIPDPQSASFRAVDPDGTRRWIVHGMRLVERIDGSIERGDQMLPAAQHVRSLKLPPRLGHGYVFYLNSAGTTLVWRADSWVGALRPLANVDFDVSEIVCGFDRLYLIEHRTGAVVAIDATSGHPMDLGALPPSPVYGSMAFADGWLGAVDVPLRGTLVTFDAGVSWRPLDLGESYGVSLDHSSLVVATSAGRFTLGPSGVLHEDSNGPAAGSLFHGAGRDPAYVKLVEGDFAKRTGEHSPEGPLGRHPLRTAVLYGWPDSSATAVVAENGVVARVRLSDGRLLDVSRDAFGHGGSCQAVRLGASFGFVCGERRGSTVIYSFAPPLGVRPVLSFDEPRYVASSGNGGLVIRGSCRAHAHGAVDAYCVFSPSGKLREVRVRGDRGVERVVALSDGRTAVLVPPRLGAPGMLMLIAASGKTTSFPLKLRSQDKPTLELLRRGLWLDGLVERGNELAGWVAGSGPFVGVRVALNGGVTAGKIQNDVEHALLSGPFALVLGRSDAAAETIDGGFQWREVELPADFDATSMSGSSLAAQPRGCSPVGCAAGPWVRVGWRGHGNQDDMATVDPPQQTRLKAPQGSRWLLSCAATGEVEGRPGSSEAVRRSSHRSSRRARRYRVSRATPGPGTFQSTRWLDFLGESPPAKHPGDVRFDHGTEYQTLQMRGYVWGARGANWSSVGSWLLRIADRFSVKGGVWSTAVSRSPWDDMATAAQAFGVEPSAGPTNWSAMLDPSGGAGVLLINARGSAELYVFQRDRSIVKVLGAAAAGVTNLAGAVKVGSTWYIGSRSTKLEFSIFRIDSGTIKLFHSYREREARQARASLPSRVVRSVRGNALGIWTEGRALRGGETTWFVYPVDLRTGEIAEPLVLSPERLSKARACGDDNPDGWLLEGRPPIEPYLDFAASAQSVRVRHVEGRLIANANVVCIDALAAQADSLIPRSLRPPAQGVASWARGQPTATLALTDRGSGRRWGFRCVH